MQFHLINAVQSKLISPIGALMDWSLSWNTSRQKEFQPLKDHPVKSKKMIEGNSNYMQKVKEIC